jgi:cell division protein FtsB
MSQCRAKELPISSKQQPSSLTQRRSTGIEPGIAAVLLAALGFSLVLGYAAASATIARNGYVEMGVRQEVEELRAEIALLRYQIHLAESGERIRQVAARLGLSPVDPVHEVDYILLPHPASAGPTELARGVGEDSPADLASALAEFAAGVVASAEGRAEASTVEGHHE